MSVAEILERKLGAALGLRPRRGASAALERELARLRRERGMTPDEVLRRFDADPAFVRELATAVTVEETFFLRHPEHFAQLVRFARERLARDDAPELRLWSAGCASGEEPYSMAIALHRALGPEALARVRIVANDVDAVSLAKARGATYGEWSFRGTEAWLRPTYFTGVGPGSYRLRDTLRDAVRFEHRSLEEQLASLAPGSVDVVFFRNVAIYLTDEAQSRVYHGIAQVLRPGGLLVLGPADPMPANLELTRARVEHAASHAALALASAAEYAAPVTARGPSIPGAAPAETAARTERPPAPTPSYDLDTSQIRLLPPPREEQDAALRSVARLVVEGRAEAALTRIDEELAHAGPTASWLGMRGRTRLELGQVELAVQDLRSALFLGPTDVLLRFHYALALEAAARPRPARAQAFDALNSLEATPDDALLSDGITTAASVRRAAFALIERVA